MEILLSPSCQSLSGALSKKDGYALRMQTGRDGTRRCFAQRNPNNNDPCSQLRFINKCAQLAGSYPFLDIRVRAREFAHAIDEAFEDYDLELADCVATLADMHDMPLDAEQVKQLLNTKIFGGGKMKITGK